MTNIDALIQGPLLDVCATDLPLGARISTDCPSKRFIEMFAPERFFDFDKGVGQAGHDIADRFIERRLYTAAPGSRLSVVREKSLPWKHGVSHIDAAVSEGPLAGCWEVKSTSRDWRKETVSPTADNRRQVLRMLYVAETTGVKLPEPFRIVIVCKKDLMCVGPFGVSLTDEDRDELRSEFALFDSWIARADTIDLDTDEELRDNCRCRTCFPKPRVNADHAQGDLIGAITSDQARLKTLEPEVKQLKERIKKRRAELAPLVPDGVVVDDGFGTATKRADGALIVKKQNEVAA